ncbi:MAG: hypothetical protein OET57_17155, partial [Desulfobacteraceae bacterium]|nr:hypothetical protein [Desulfobacteraceae bacterium]
MTPSWQDRQSAEIPVALAPVVPSYNVNVWVVSVWFQSGPSAVATGLCGTWQNTQISVTPKAFP